jgi:hypothetical protein
MHLDTVQEIERAIKALTPQQREELYQWIEQHHPQPANRATAAPELPVLHLGAMQPLHRRDIYNDVR